MDLVQLCPHPSEAVGARGRSLPPSGSELIELGMQGISGRECPSPRLGVGARAQGLTGRRLLGRTIEVTEDEDVRVPTTSLQPTGRQLS